MKLIKINTILLSVPALFLLSVLFGKLNAQFQINDPAEVIYDFLLATPNEKYVVNTDRDIYFINDNIWISIWSIDDITNIPVTRSKALYVELVGNDGNPIAQNTLLIENNIASGKLQIPYSVNSGIYYLRAYSNWQKNYGTDFFGIKIIQIINPYKVPAYTDTSTSKLKITCFPEGGQIIRGIENKILLEFRDSYGNYIDPGSVSLMDQNDSLVSGIKKLWKGFAIISLTPEEGKDYYFSDSENLNMPLNIRDQGIVVQSLLKPDTLRILINGKTNNEEGNFHLIARNSGKIFFVKDFAFRNNPLYFDFIESLIPDGLTEFAVLHNNNLISQRLFFKKSGQQPITLNVSPAKSAFSTREPVKIQVSTPDPNNIDFITIAVRKKGLLLSSLLPGIYSGIQLNSYVNDWDDFLQLGLHDEKDDIGNMINEYLISKSIKRYNWDSVLSGVKTNISYYPEADVRYITGEASNLITNEPVTGEKLLMYFVNQIPYILMSNIDESGNFRFSEPLKRISKQEVLIQSQKTSEGLAIKFDWPYYQAYSPYNLNYFYFDSLSYEAFDEAYQKWQVNMIHKDRIENLYEKTGSDQLSSLYGPPDRRFYLKDYIQFNNMFEVFKEIVERVRVVRRDENYIITILDENKNAIIGNNPLLLFNGHQIDNINTVMNIPVQSINFIDVITQRFYIGDQKYDGVVNVVPKDIMIKAEIPQGSSRYVFDFINDQYNFTTRDYSTDKNNPLPDLRNTVYWNPEFRFKNPSEEIVFYSGDDKGEFELEIKGMGTNGELIYATQIILIK